MHAPQKSFLQPCKNEDMIDIKRDFYDSIGRGPKTTLITTGNLKRLLAQYDDLLSKTLECCYTHMDMPSYSLSSIVKKQTFGFLIFM